MKHPDVLPSLADALTKEEQQRFLDNSQKIASSVVYGNGYLIQALCVFISYGWKWLKY